MAEHEVVGVITKRVIDVFKLELREGTKIFCGESNIAHMKEEHPEDFAKYGDRIADIISEPTYICKPILTEKILKIYCLLWVII